MKRRLARAEQMLQAEQDAYLLMLQQAAMEDSPRGERIRELLNLARQRRNKAEHGKGH